MKYAKAHIISMYLITLLFVCNAPIHSQVETITLQSKEGTKFSISKDAAFISHLISDLYGDFGPEKGEVFTLPLPNMNDITLRSAIKYLNIALKEYKKEVPGFNPKFEKERKEFQNTIIKALGTAIKDNLNRAKDPVGQAVVLIKIGNYLDFPELIEAASIEASKLASWENIKNKYWGILSLEMNNRVAYWMVQNNRDAFFPLIINQTTPFGHLRKLNTAQFTPDGKKIVTSADDEIIIIWNAETGMIMDTLEGHVSQIKSAKISPDGTKIVTASEDRTAKIWNIKTGKLIHSLNEHKDEVSSAEFNSDNTKIITASNDETIKVWDVETGKLLYTLDSHLKGLVYAQFSPDDIKIISFSMKFDSGPPWPNTVEVWDIKTKEIIHSLRHTDLVFSAQFSPENTMIITASADGIARVWDVETGDLLYSLEGHMKGLVYAQFSPDGTKIVTASWDKTAKIWDIKTGKIINTLKGHTYGVIYAQFSPDGTKIVTASWDKTAKIWDVESGRLIHSLPKQKIFHKSPLTISPDGTKRIYFGRIPEIVDTTTGELLYTLPRDVRGDTFSFDGKKILTTSKDMTAQIWNAQTGQLIHTLVGHTDKLLRAIFSSDDTKVMTTSYDETCKVWDTQTGQLLYSVPLSGNLNTAEFSPDSKKVITLGPNYTVSIRDAQTGQLIHSLKGHTSWLESAQFIPDGSKIVTTSDDRTTKVWDASTGELICSLEGYKGYVRYVQFSIDSTKIIISPYRKARVLDLSLPWIKHYADQFTIPQALLITALNAQYIQDKQTSFNQLEASTISRRRLKQIFKTFHPNIQRSLTKRFNIIEMKPEEIFEESRKQLGL